MARQYQSKRQKLSKAEYYEIRRLASTKRHTYEEIGAKFGISASWVAELVKRGDKR